MMKLHIPPIICENINSYSDTDRLSGDHYNHIIKDRLYANNCSSTTSKLTNTTLTNNQQQKPEQTHCNINESTDHYYTQTRIVNSAQDEEQSIIVSSIKQCPNIIDRNINIINIDDTEEKIVIFSEDNILSVSASPSVINSGRDNCDDDFLESNSQEIRKELMKELADIDELPISELFSKLSQVEEDIFLQKQGYKKITKISDTLQGDIFEYEQINDNNKRRVAVKRTDKSLHQQRISIQDDFRFIIDQNIIKETLILKHLTFDNAPIGDTIVKYIDFMESSTDYYLIMEYVDTQYTLKSFVEKSHEYIRNGQLKLNRYKKITKFIFWQLITTLHWMHYDMNC